MQQNNLSHEFFINLPIINEAAKESSAESFQINTIINQSKEKYDFNTKFNSIINK